jgi:peptidoglycan biosynthesis protein MviN/MurJ (putative lipid II flippase)
MLVSIASILINYLAAWSLTRHTALGHAGLALATSGVSLFASLALFWILRGRMRGIHGRALVASTLKIGLASLVMGGAVMLVSAGTHNWLGVSRLQRLVELAVSIPLGVAVFGAVCRTLGVAELETATRALLSPLARRRTGLSQS